MSRRSVSASLEAKLLEVLRSLVPEIPAVGFLETADAGTVKNEDPTAFQVRVYNFRQANEAFNAFVVSVEIRLNVEMAESANGGLFLNAHEKVALWLENIMLGDECEALSTDEADIVGFQRTGDDKDFDTMTDEWFASWDMTLSGHVKIGNEQHEQEADNESDI